MGATLLSTVRSPILALLSLIAVLAALCLPAAAHPHIWIDARITVEFDDSGAITALEHEWTFDEAFSSWTLQGLERGSDGKVLESELDAIAAENMIGLREYDYYTFAGAGEEDVHWTAGPNPTMTYDGARSTLRYRLIPDAPVQPGPRFEIEVTDPEYYAAFTFLTSRGVTLTNAPENCSAEINPPHPISPELEEQLFALGPDVTELPPELKAATEDLANVVLILCEGNAPATALQAIETQAQSSSRPFVAPPAEKGLPVARTGFMGWVNQQQQAFYGALTRALSHLTTDGTAFWTLGALSFLYGVFHAAGPGHGKVVISSYVLASQSELQRGIGLSFASALVQSLTAILFVSVAAWLLNMTSVALSAASGWLVAGSYVLVVLLGVWLILRKIPAFNRLIGHEHSHHHHGHSHDHDHDHHHEEAHMHHAVAPSQTRGSWREMLGVVLAVGLRPCSGALVVLVFALSQGVFAAGIVAVFLMGIGTALTVAVLASLAVGLKGAAGLMKGGPLEAVAMDVIWWLELFGAVLVLAFGIVLLMANI